MSEAYLDIETTGLSWAESQITVIGVYLVNGEESRVVQLVGNEATGENLLKTIDGVHTVFTYNGSRFDLPFIKAAIGVDLNLLCKHHDLMYDCWNCGLYGGFKAVERKLDINRELQGINGWDAVILWQRYQRKGDTGALTTLLHYNREDIVNLKALRERIEQMR